MIKTLLASIIDAHAVYHEQLIDECDIEESNQYFDAVKLYQHRTWQLPSAHAISEEPTPEDSISSVASRADKKLSRHSKSSSVSSVSATKAKAAAKRAILEAEAATLETFQAIQREELSLHLRKITKAQAEEVVYAEAEASYNYQSSNLWTNAAAKAKYQAMESQVGHTVPYHPWKLKSLAESSF
ncbi:hypothetical protein OS493_032371 [Desmophyllum pertusum]|uniref:Uncharacterized protein n=1 Tax=Desmophyllum pertusum TaxID=174260 RepID=A0A9W9YJH8_9CNID|nr:hypothetical protein OS493_032371 [Desmophyllum pertusum]